MFIDQNFARNFKINYLDEPVIIQHGQNRGTISSYVDLEFKLGDQTFNERFHVTGLGKQNIILGFPWLHKHNLIIDWKKGEITWKPYQIDWKHLIKKGQRIKKEWQPRIEEFADEEKKKNKMTSLMEEDKKEIFIKLLETDV
jgi:hypothetical protein